MSKHIKKSIKNISISGIRQFNSLASQYDDVIKLTIGELDFNTPSNIKEKTIDAIKDNKTRYTSNIGLLKLRSQIISTYDQYFSNEVIITSGSTEALMIVLRSIIDKGDEVIIPTPAYPGYKPLIDLEGGVVRTVDSMNIKRKTLEKAYTEHTKLMIITNPNNPTGYVYSEEEMEVIKQFVLDKDILLISDEIYNEINFAPYNSSFTKFKDLKQNLIVISGFSKSHAMTGYRIGYLISDESLVKHFLKVHQYSVTCATSISQYAAVEATKTKYKIMVSTLKERRDIVIKKLRQLGLSYYPSNGAYYIFVDVSKYNNGYDFAVDLLKKQKVAVIPGSAFLGDNDDFIRISYATDTKTLIKALNRLEQYIKSLKKSN